MDAARLERLQALKSVSEQARIGGKGSARRKRKVVHKTAATDDKKLQATLKKLGINVIPSIEEVNMYRADGTMIHFKNPRVQASPQANMFAVSGLAENKTVLALNDLFPSMMKAAQGENKDNAEDDDDDVPELVGDFEEKSRQE
ncbi:unnamed protein product [Taenia asiatica]|uniref:Transcription factor BTF3 n=1 Tax=Taenia asiatica TaxID=60517 RepID=A0A0R3W265_TAEAS|nr:unnamed protein product [Taenia asiatica]